MSDYCKVLIVDDELITRQGLKHMLLWEQEGFQIVGEASNGQEGLELIEKLQPHIVLADIVMPVLNGIDFSLILQEKYPDIRLIVLSSYDNFEYVKATLLNGAVDYVLKPTLSPPLLLEALQRAARSIPGLELRKSESVSVKKQLERYLAGYQEQLEERAFGEFFPHMQYRLLGVDLKSACGSNKKQADRMRDWIEESFKSQETYTQMSAFVEEEILCCLFNFRRKEEHLLLKDIRAAVHKVAQIEERVLFIISEPFTELAQVKKRYQQGICPYGKQKFYFPDTNLVFEKECTAAKEVERFDYDAYTACLNGRRYGEVLRLLKEYITYICEKHYDEYLVKNLTKNLLYNLLMEIEKYGISSDELKEEYFHRIDRAVSVDCFLEQCADIFGQLSGLIGQQIGDEDSRILEMKQYIHRHYNEVLDLAEISQVFNFNYHYISTYFNQHIPEGFSGYLNKIRVAKACSLLRESTMTIAEVSGEVGYSDHSYFCRVFKKMTGHTPSQYRHSAKQGKL